MKNPYEVLRVKELELQRIQKEIDALRLAAQLLDGDESTPDAEEKTNLRQMVQLP